MAPQEPVTLIAAFLAALLMGLGILRFAHPLGLVALPNTRSSHSRPTPTGGGLAVALVVVVVLLAQAGEPASLALGAAAALLAAIGLWDDVRELGRTVRFGIQLVAVAGFLALAGTALPPMWLVPLGIASLWFVNLFNFMDGIDGIAGVQMLTFAVGTWVLADAPPQWILATQLALAGGALGFLALNWPPARIFLGDVGSLSIGLVIAGLMICLADSGSLNPFASLILVSAFVTDASWTLAVRALTGQNPFDSHRSHLYQHLARRYGHLRTTAGYAAFVLAWLFPLAGAAAYDPRIGLPALTAAALPVLVLAIRLGAGRADGPNG